MLDKIIGFIETEKIELFNYAEATLALYEYKSHTIELESIITDLLEDSNANTFNRQLIDIYNLAFNTIFSLVGLKVSSIMLLSDKIKLAKSLIDINDKEEANREHTYQQLADFDNNEDILIHILTSLNALEDTIVLSDIYGVSDGLIENLEAMLRGSEDTLEDTVKVSLLRRILISILGDAENVIEAMDKFEPFIEDNISTLLSKEYNSFLTEDSEILIRIIIALAFTVDGRERPIVTYLAIKDKLPEDYTDNLDTFVHALITNLQDKLKQKGF